MRCCPFIYKRPFCPRRQLLMQTVRFWLSLDGECVLDRSLYLWLLPSGREWGSSSPSEMCLAAVSVSVTVTLELELLSEEEEDSGVAAGGGSWLTGGRGGGGVLGLEGRGEDGWMTDSSSCLLGYWHHTACEREMQGVSEVIRWAHIPPCLHWNTHTTIQ